MKCSGFVVKTSSKETYRRTTRRHARTLRSNKCRSFVIGHLLATTFAIRKFCYVEGGPRFREDDVA